MDEFKGLQLKPFDPAKCLDYTNMKGIGLIFVPERYQQPGMPKVTLFNASDLSCNLYGSGVILKMMNEESKLLTNHSSELSVLPSSSLSLANVVKEPETTFQTMNESNMLFNPRSNSVSGYQNQGNSDAMWRSETLRTVALPEFSNPSISQFSISSPLQGLNFNSKPLSQSQVIPGQSSLVGSSIDRSNLLCGTQSQVPFTSSNLKDYYQPQVLSLSSRFDINPVNQPQVPFTSVNFDQNQVSQLQVPSAHSNFGNNHSVSQGQSSFVNKPGLLRPGPFGHLNFGSNRGPFFDFRNNPSLLESGSSNLGFADSNCGNNPVSQAQLPVTGANSIPLGKNSIWDSNFGKNTLNNAQNYHNSNNGTIDSLVQPSNFGRNTLNNGQNYHSSNIGTNDSLVQPSNVGTTMFTLRSNEQFQSSIFPENPNHFTQKPNVYLHSSNFTENSNHSFHGKHTLHHGSSIDNNSFSHPTNVQFNSNCSNNSNHSFNGNHNFYDSNVANNSLSCDSNLQFPSYNFTNTNNSSDGSCTFQNSKLATDEREILPTRLSNAPNNQITGPNLVNAAEKKRDTSIVFRGRNIRDPNLSPRRRYRRYGGRVKRNYRN